MQNRTILAILSEWTDEFVVTLMKNNSLCIALFSASSELIFANNSMSALFKGEPHLSFINPTFEKLLTINNSEPLIFDGFLTLGDYSSINTSITAQIYRKGDKLLVLGNINSSQLLEQNVTMHQLNTEINNLQRELIKEKYALENTLTLFNLANNDLKELNTSKDRFISILAHDLKSPFGSILGFLELLKENIREYSLDKIEDQLSMINDAAKTTYNLLEEILLWIQAESGKLPFEPQKLSLIKIFNRVIENLEHTASNKNIKITHFLTSEIDIFADFNMINTIFRNLVSNAIKFTHYGGVINIYAVQNLSDVTITITDNGVGMDPDIINKLFDFSYKITTEGTAQEKGTGLGLLLCKDFVEKHGGKIWAESQLGKGSVFKFTLPLDDGKS
jgi:two-component system, sensor histidine kinase and response regulator